MNDRPGRPPLISRGCLAGLFIGSLGLLLSLLARSFPHLTETIYSRTVYPPLAGLLARVSGVFPFSLGEWVVAGLFLGVLIAFLRAWRRARRSGRNRWIALGAAELTALGWAGWVYALFLLAWGFNYSRTPIQRTFALPRVPDRPRVEALVQEIGRRMDSLRALLPEGEKGAVALTLDRQALDQELRDLQAQVLQDYGLPPVPHGRVKSFLVSPLLLRWGVSGVYSPFTWEPNIVLPAAPGLLPAVMAHERAHLSGFGHEDDANFLTLLTTWRSACPQVRYSGWLSLWLHLGRGTRGRSPGVVRDLSAIQKFFNEHRGRERGTVWKAYGTYLKSQGVKGGTASYSRVTGLALRHLDRYGLPRDPLVSWIEPLPPPPLRP